ncbi:hypothetical protein [Sphingobium sp. B2]|nr:hypothetical protein [Sphingobium sp. B2]
MRFGRRPNWTCNGFVPVSYTHLDVYKRQINGIKPVRTRKHKRCV